MVFLREYIYICEIFGKLFASRKIQVAKLSASLKDSRMGTLTLRCSRISTSNVAKRCEPKTSGNVRGARANEVEGDKEEEGEGERERTPPNDSIFVLGTRKEIRLLFRNLRGVVRMMRIAIQHGFTRE